MKLVILVGILLSWTCNSYPDYVRNFPNGDKVKFDGESWPGVGHTKVFGGGPLNTFGKDFLHAGNKWTVELCQKDSDGDGRTNGEELGDPNCTWKYGDPSPKVPFVTHPGVADECPTPVPAPTKMKIAILGAGNVGKALMRKFSEDRLSVAFGVRDVNSHSGEGAVMELKEAAEWGTIIFLAVPGTTVVELAKSLEESLRGKIVVDCTNPTKWDKGPVWNPPPEGSLTAAIVAALPKSKVVKAFNTFGSEHHEIPNLTGAPAQVFIAGDDVPAKKIISQLANNSGFLAIDAGPLRNAAVLENMAILWIHLATVGGKGRDFTIGMSQ